VRCWHWLNRHARLVVCLVEASQAVAPRCCNSASATAALVQVCRPVRTPVLVTTRDAALSARLVSIDAMTASPPVNPAATKQGQCVCRQDNKPNVFSTVPASSRVRVDRANSLVELGEHDEDPPAFHICCGLILQPLTDNPGTLEAICWKSGSFLPL